MYVCYVTSVSQARWKYVFLNIIFVLFCFVDWDVNQMLGAFEWQNGSITE